MKKKTFLTISTVCAVIFAIATACVVYIPWARVPDSTVLTKDVIEGYCRSEMRSILITVGVILTLAALSGITNKSKYDTEGDKVSKRQLLSPLGVLVAGIFICQSNLLIAYDIVTNEPRVEIVTLARKEDRHSRKHRYLGVFSNGADDYISTDEYKYCPEGTVFYVIMCGDTCVEHFDTNRYILHE